MDRVSRMSYGAFRADLTSQDLSLKIDRRQEVYCRLSSIGTIGLNISLDARHSFEKNSAQGDFAMGSGIRWDHQ
jgi:hypothetical protein